MKKNAMKFTISREDIKFDTTVISPTRQTAGSNQLIVHNLRKTSTNQPQSNSTTTNNTRSEPKSWFININKDNEMDLTKGYRKPKQVFWHKRFDEQQEDDDDEDNYILPKKIKKVQPATELGALASLTTALHLTKTKTPVVGQSKDFIDRENLDPAIFINPDQPPVQQISVQEEDIQYQESQLREARKRLADAVSISLL